MSDLLIELLIFAIIVSLIWFVITRLPLPPLVAAIFQVVLAVLAVFWMIGLLMDMSGVPLIGHAHWRR